MIKNANTIRWLFFAVFSVVFLTLLGSAGLFADSDVFVFRAIHHLSLEVSSWLQAFRVHFPTQNALLEKVVGGGAGTP